MAFPNHIAIVMDGNGRWAEQRRRHRTMGHQAGLKSARGVVQAAGEMGVKTLTLFAFSSENWNRPVSEVRRLMELFLKALRREIDDLDKNDVRVRFIGDRTRLNPSLREGMANAEHRTRGNSGLTLVIAINYGGRWDISQAAQRVALDVIHGRLDVREVNEVALHERTSLREFGDPDLLIRTGGERRISNFLLWQSAYTELYFSDTLWPDFDAAELRSAIDDFSHRQRRFGRIDDPAVADVKSA